MRWLSIIYLMKRLVVVVSAVMVLSCGKRMREVKRSGQAFGSYVLIRAQGEGVGRLNLAVDSVMNMFARFNRLWSVYSESSEVSLLNRQGRAQVSAETRDLILLGVEFGKRTQGVFDITVGPLMRLWGFRRGDYRLPDREEVERVKRAVGYQRVKVQGDSVFLEPGMELDLGGIAVGYALDRAVLVLKALGATAGLIDAGGDIVVFGEREWRIGIQSPRGESVVGVLVLKNQAVSTSGDYRRFFESGGRRFSHIIDPRTGFPAERCAAVTVVARTGIEADVFSTSLFVTGPDAGQEFLQADSGLRAIFYVVKGDSLVRVELKGGGS